MAIVEIDWQGYMETIILPIIIIAILGTVLVFLTGWACAAVPWVKHCAYVMGMGLVLYFGTLSAQTEPRGATWFSRITRILAPIVIGVGIISRPLYLRGYVIGTDFRWWGLARYSLRDCETVVAGRFVEIEPAEAARAAGACNSDTNVIGIAINRFSGRELVGLSGATPRPAPDLFMRFITGPLNEVIFQLGIRERPAGSAAFGCAEAWILPNIPFYLRPCYTFASGPKANWRRRQQWLPKLPFFRGTPPPGQQKEDIMPGFVEIWPPCNYCKMNLMFANYYGDVETALRPASVLSDCVMRLPLFALGPSVVATVGMWLV